MRYITISILFFFIPSFAQALTYIETDVKVDSVDVFLPYNFPSAQHFHLNIIGDATDTDNYRFDFSFDPKVRRVEGGRNVKRMWDICKEMAQKAVENPDRLLLHLAGDGYQNGSFSFKFEGRFTCGLKAVP
jgi:hypothetical protein